MHKQASAGLPLFNEGGRTTRAYSSASNCGWPGAHCCREPSHSEAIDMCRYASMVAGASISAKTFRRPMIEMSTPLELLAQEAMLKRKVRLPRRSCCID